VQVGGGDLKPKSSNYKYKFTGKQREYSTWTYALFSSIIVGAFILILDQRAACKKGRANIQKPTGANLVREALL
jgi:hypothetical protein